MSNKKKSKDSAVTGGVFGEDHFEPINRHLTPGGFSVSDLPLDRTLNAIQSLNMPYSETDRISNLLGNIDPLGSVMRDQMGTLPPTEYNSLGSVLGRPSYIDEIFTPGSSSLSNYSPEARISTLADDLAAQITSAGLTLAEIDPFKSLLADQVGTLPSTECNSLGSVLGRQIHAGANDFLSYVGSEKYAPSSFDSNAHEYAPTSKPISKPSAKSTRIKNLEILGSMVRARRDELGLSQQELADIAGVGRRFISEFERGKITIEFGKAIDVLNACGIDLGASCR